MHRSVMLIACCITINVILVSGSSVSDQINQTPVNTLKELGDVAKLKCSHSIQNYDQILLYKQSENNELQLLGYMVGNNAYPEIGINVKMSGSANKDKTCTLTIEELKPNSSAVYFCAAPGQGVFGGGAEAYFGGGTKLTVLDPEIKITPPEVEILKPSDKECKNKKTKKKKKTLVCVAKNFYPDHVSVFWQVDGEDQTNGVATDEAAQRIGSYYRITSRLRVSAKEWFTPGKNFTCVVHFFNGTVTETRENFTVNENAHESGRISREKYLSITRNAILTYGVLVAKSCAYGAFVGVLVWKLQSSAKKHH